MRLQVHIHVCVTACVFPRLSGLLPSWCLFLVCFQSHVVKVVS